MGAITSISGTDLLNTETVTSIEDQVSRIQKDKDVAAAWTASRHLKTEIAKLPQDAVKPVLDRYRLITAKLKVIALSLLSHDEIVSLLKYNAQFLGAQDLTQLDNALSQWLALQDEEPAKDAKKEFSDIASTQHLDLPRLTGTAPSTQPQKPAAAQSAPQKSPDADFFDVDEQKEVVKHTEKAASQPAAPLDTSPSGMVAQKIAALSKTNDAETFRMRAAALVKSRLRDVRTVAELKDYFARPFAVGGLGLSSADVQKASSLTEEAYASIHATASATPPVSAPRVNVSAEQKNQPVAPKESTPLIPKERPAEQRTQQPAPSPVHSKITTNVETAQQKNPSGGAAEEKIKKRDPEQKDQFLNKPGEKIWEATEEKEARTVAPKKTDPKKLENDLTHDIDALINAEVPAIQPTPTKTQASPAKKISVQSAPASPVVSQPKKAQEPLSRPSIVRPKASGTKPRLDDIVRGSSSRPQHAEPAQESVGQADELRFITLADFRLHGTPEEAVAYVVQRIQLLGQDSIEDRISGIHQFRSSELFKQYLNIGKKGLSGGSSLADALQDKELNPDGMTEDEFFAIASLSSKLK